MQCTHALVTGRNNKSIPSEFQSWGNVIIVAVIIQNHTSQTASAGSTDQHTVERRASCVSRADKPQRKTGEHHVPLHALLYSAVTNIRYSKVLEYSLQPIFKLRNQYSSYSSPRLGLRAEGEGMRGLRAGACRS